LIPGTAFLLQMIEYIVWIIGWPAKAGVWFLLHPGYAIFADGNFRDRGQGTGDRG
jgi:hypothetical protein